MADTENTDRRPQPGDAPLGTWADDVKRRVDEQLAEGGQDGK